MTEEQVDFTVKVIVTKYATSGRIEVVDLQPYMDGRYFSGDAEGYHYFICKRDALTSKELARKRIVEKFVAKRKSLVDQLERLTKTEMEVLSQLDRLTL